MIYLNNKIDCANPWMLNELHYPGSKYETGRAARLIKKEIEILENTI